jgi:hypothetical protein
MTYDTKANMPVKKEQKYKEMFVVIGEDGRMVGCCHTMNDAVTLCGCLGVENTSDSVKPVKVITFHTYQENDEPKPKSPAWR